MISAILATAPDQHPTEARFTKIPGSEIDVLVRCDEFPDFGQYIGCHKSYNAFIDWTGGAWNWNGWEFVLPAGGGHADYGGNELYVAKLVDKNGALAVDWSRPIDPQPLNDADCGAPISGPVASHTYAAPVYVEAHDEYWHVTTGGWPATTGCSERNQDKAPGMGGWVTDKVEWRKTHNATDHVMSYTQACYLRERDIIYVLRAGPTMRFKVHPKDNYRVENIGGGGWVNTSGHYDTAGDQVRNICYEYQPQVGIFGRYHGASGESEQVFQSKSKTLSIPSLSVEHSTGNLVAVGVDGYALHINTQTGEELDISAESGLKTRTATGKNIYGKFDMIEKIPCVGVGLADAREGVYLMTLPATVCTMDESPLATVNSTEPAPPLAQVTGVGGWTTGVALSKGNTFSTKNQFNCISTWSEGTCKFGILSGHTEGKKSPKVSASSISVQLGDRKVQPVEPYYEITGNYMNEAHYRVLSGDLLVLFYVRQYADSRHVIVAIENGFLNKTTPTLEYDAVVTVGRQTEKYKSMRSRTSVCVCCLFVCIWWVFV